MIRMRNLPRFEHVIAAFESRNIAILVAATFCMTVAANSEAAEAERGAGAPPNILVIVLDDIGIDQAGFPPFNWTQSEWAPRMPVLAEIAAKGVSFTNFWATPECSPTRAAILTGRFGFRTGVVTALVDPMLPVNQLHPSEITIQKLLGEAGYRTSMFGKYHLGGGPENTPPGYGYQAPATTARLDFYDGYWSLPPNIDETIGGQVAAGTYTCGAPTGDPNFGAACFPNGTCIDRINPYTAMALGGTPLLDRNGNLAANCSEGDCSAIDFQIANGYYKWQRYITDANGSTTIPAALTAEYLTSFISRRSAEWINEARSAGVPWCCFAMHSSGHTPVQTPPPTLTGDAPGASSCDALTAPTPPYRLAFRQMCESLDKSIGAMLVDLDLATITKSGGVELLDPAITNTMIVVLGDNGSLGTTVLNPFSPTNSKQTVYQTGTWTPCIVAGPMVVQPNRAVDAVVNCVDLYGLILDSAGVDWQAQIPPQRIVDSRPMLPYLSNPTQAQIREIDFTMYRQGTFVSGECGPCLMGATVVDNLFSSPTMCVANGGTWLSSDETPYSPTDFCGVEGVFTVNGVDYCFGTACKSCTDCTPANPPTLQQFAVRHGRWKLVLQEYPDCVSPSCVLEFFHLAEFQAPNQPGLDRPGANGNSIPLDALSKDQQTAFNLLAQAMYDLLASNWYCPGDGNLDKQINAEDLTGLLASWGYPGFWDSNNDGTTDGEDLATVLSAWGTDCVGTVNTDGQDIPSCLIDALP